MRPSRLVSGIAAVTALFTAGVWTGLSGAGQGVERATTLGLTARLNAAQEVPRPRARVGAGGAFAGGLVRSGAGGRLTWRLTFQRLSGAAAASHVHIGKRGKPGGVAVALCGPCRSGARGTARLNAKTVRALLSGNAYVNVHTARNAAGEIRGQISTTAAPPPAPPPSQSTGTTTGTTTYDDPY